MATMMTSNNIIRASEGDSYEDISTNHISEWRSIVTLIVFVIASTLFTSAPFLTRSLGVAGN